MNASAAPAADATATAATAAPPPSFAALAGRLARETAPDSAAAREITALVDELLRWPT